MSFVAAAHDPLLSALTTMLDRVVITVITDVYGPDATTLTAEIGDIRPIRLAMLDALTQRDTQRLVDAVATYHAVSERVVRGHPELNEARLSDRRWAPLLSALG